MIVLGGVTPNRKILNGHRFGVRPAQFGAGGTHPNPLTNDVDPGDDLVEFCAVVKTLPTAGTLAAYDDGSFEQEAPDGTWPWQLDVYTYTPGDPAVVLRGTETISYLFGPAAIAVSVASVDSGDDVTALAVTLVPAKAIAVSVASVDSGDDVTSLDVSVVEGIAAIAVRVNSVDTGDDWTSATVSLYTPRAISVSVAGRDDGDDRTSVAVRVELPPVPPMVRGTRVVDSKRRTPRRLDDMDIDESDTVVFHFGKELAPKETIASFAATAEARVGTDPSAVPLIDGAAEVQGDSVVLPISGQRGLPGVIYLLRGLVTTSRGRTLLAAAFIRLVRTL